MARLSQDAIALSFHGLGVLLHRYGAVRSSVTELNLSPGPSRPLFLENLSLKGMSRVGDIGQFVGTPKKAMHN